MQRQFKKTLPILLTLLLVPASSFAQGWVTQTSGTTLDLNGVFFIDATTGWVVGDSGKILHTSDAGGIWTSQTSGTSSRLFSVHFVDPHTGWVSGESGTILHTTDAGLTWNIQISGTTLVLEGTFFIDATTGWVVGYDGAILHTANGGTVWTTQQSNTDDNLVSVHFTDSDTGWTVGWNFPATYAGMHYTTDGGTTWSERFVPLPETFGIETWLDDIYFIDGRTGWAVGWANDPNDIPRGWVLKTTNGGTFWSSEFVWDVGGLASVDLVNANLAWATAYSFVTHTTDGGSTWSRLPMLPPVLSVDFIDATTGWAVGDSGSIYHTTDGGTGVEPPDAPTLDSPPNGANVSTSPLLIWGPSPDALWYTLEVSTSPYFITPLLNKTNITEPEFQLSGLQADTTYYWRVSVTDDTWTSRWSGSWSFSTSDVPAPVILVSPENEKVVTGDSVELTWHESPDVDLYWLEGATDSLFSNPFIDSTLTDTSSILSPVHHDQTFWWRVKAHNVIGWGGFSDVWSFLVYQEIPSPPMLQSPLDGEIVVPSPTPFSWTPVVGAQAYTIQVSDTIDFSRLIVDEEIDGTSYDADLDNNTVYHWRVNATNDLGSSDWSVVWSFRTIIAQPSLSSPPNGAVGEPTLLPLNWHPVGGQPVDTLFYYLQLSLEDGFLLTLIADSTIVDTSYQVGPLDSARTYFWRVRAKDGLSTGPWSPTWDFTTIIGLLPGQVVLAEPENGAILGDLEATCRWLPGSPGVDRYWFEWATDSMFTESTIDSAVSDTSAIVSSLTNDETYWWKVRANNKQGWGPFSEVWSFSVLVTGAVEEGAIPDEFTLSQNYPNPFNPSTTIRYGLPERLHVRVEVFDLVGERIAVLVDGEQDAAYHSVVFDGQGLASGMYFYRLQAGDFVDTRKLLLLK